MLLMMVNDDNDDDDDDDDDGSEAGKRVEGRESGELNIERRIRKSKVNS